MQKSEEKRKIPRSGRYVTISPLFFSYFPHIFLLLFLHFSSTEEARTKNGSGLGLRKTRKGGWMGGTGQNDVVLGQTNKKKFKAPAWAASLHLDGRRKKKKKKEKEKECVPGRTVGGDSGDCYAPCALKRRLRDGVLPPFRRGAGGWRCAAPSLGAP